MSTEAQTAANRRNATTFGLYSAGDVVRRDEESLYRAFSEDFHRELAPQGAMESTFAAEIVHAAWRLRRCAEAESTLEAQSGLDPMLDPATAAAQNSIDRARAQALRHFHRATAELRRLQKERQNRTEFPSEEQRPPLLKIVTTKQTQSEPNQTVSIPRGAPCPCGSGAKYKRCCGTNAPPVLLSALLTADPRPESDMMVDREPPCHDL